MLLRVGDYRKRAGTISRSGFGLCLVLLLWELGCTPKFMGPTAPSGYRFTVIPPVRVKEHQRRVIVVRVQDAQGQPVNGVPVTFQVDPSWGNNASVAPARALTQAGQVQAVFRAGIVGRVPIKVMVEQTPYELIITVNGRGNRGSVI